MLSSIITLKNTLLAVLIIEVILLIATRVLLVIKEETEIKNMGKSVWILRITVFWTILTMIVLTIYCGKTSIP